jgi:tetratricopeptide (TPR) repeat protein
MQTLPLVVCCITACTRTPDAKPTPDAAITIVDASTPLVEAGAAKPLRRKPKTQAELTTTAADIYLGNLDARIKELTRLVTKNPSNTANLKMLSGSHHTRGRYRGDLDELALGIDEATQIVKLEPDSPDGYMMRAEQEQSLHRFKEARADVAEARKRGIDKNRAGDVEAELDWNDGRYDVAIAALRKAWQERPSTATWMREAQLRQDLGGTQDEIDEAYERAEDLISDTGPLGLAHLDLQRGIQRVLVGRLDEACTFFREAIARMPTYVAGKEHLAETLHMIGKDEEATKLYEEVVKLSDDPEFAQALGELYELAGKKDEAAALKKKAHDGYEVLVKIYPEAMYWHASEFYTKAHEPKKALDLLRKNVELRPNSTSYVALADAEMANNLPLDARKSIDKALAMPLVNAKLYWVAADVYAKSDAGKSKSFRTKALAINPKIESEK